MARGSEFPSIWQAAIREPLGAARRGYDPEGLAAMEMGIDAKRHRTKYWATYCDWLVPSVELGNLPDSPAGAVGLSAARDETRRQL